jgi:hypothetical protein
MYFSPVNTDVLKSRREITSGPHGTYKRNTKCVQDFGGINGRKEITGKA